jgi:hypothetical protein
MYGEEYEKKPSVSRFKRGRGSGGGCRRRRRRS